MPVRDKEQRDIFACAAMQISLQGDRRIPVNKRNPDGYSKDKIVEEAYAMADAMMEYRENGPRSIKEDD